jgi:hypothetical protein
VLGLIILMRMITAPYPVFGGTIKFAPEKHVAI